MGSSIEQHPRSKNYFVEQVFRVNEKLDTFFPPDPETKVNEKLEALVLVGRIILEETTPDTWDRRGYDLFRLQVRRMKRYDEYSDDALDEVFRKAILLEGEGNTQRFRLYAKNGGQVAKAAESTKPISEAPVSSNPGFVAKILADGKNLLITTEYGLVDTTTERILSFTLFQMDVLRDTHFVYPSIFKKRHEQNVAAWFQSVVEVKKTTSDAEMFNAFFKTAIVDPLSQEAALTQETRPILRNGVYAFKPNTLLDWARENERYQKLSRPEFVSALTKLYGPDFNSGAYRFKDRCWTVTAAAHDTVMGGTGRDKYDDEGNAKADPEVQHDGGGRQDDSTHLDVSGAPGEGHLAGPDPGPLVLEERSGRAEEPPPTAPQPDESGGNG
ncbi:MAG TPA: hypothetical protein PLI01_00385 [Nitrospira sp.]|nr:hypothetical protein [Nitrospira sp.]HNA25216.1 hypothetical protein [Nitrospira sp.]HNI17506.1 hypothetical protein [Nitrospira sp.]